MIANPAVRVVLDRFAPRGPQLTKKPEAEPCTCCTGPETEWFDGSCKRHPRDHDDEPTT